MSGTIAIVEQKARWYPEMLRQFANQRERVVLSSNGAELPELIARSQSRHEPLVVVFDLSNGLAAVLRHLHSRRLKTVSLSTIAIAPPASAVLEPILRELGITSFQIQPIEVGRLKSTIKYLLERDAVPNF
jgi:hypothetical protein